MKKQHILSLTLALLCILISLCGCKSSTTPKEPTAATNSENFPAPVSRKYEGQTITMSYAAITDLKWQADMQPTNFVNGYAVVYFYSEETGLECGLMDTSGKLIMKSTEYLKMSDVHADGRVIAQKKDNSYVYIDTSGNVLGVCEDSSTNWYVDTDETLWKTVDSAVPDDVKDAVIYDGKVVVASFDDKIASGSYGDYQQLLDTNWKPLNDTKFRRIGHFYNGLALCDSDGKLGIIDMAGNIVIEPTYEIATADASNPFSMNEDYYLFNADGKIGILKITRS